MKKIITTIAMSLVFSISAQSIELSNSIAFQCDTIGNVLQADFRYSEVKLQVLGERLKVSKTNFYTIIDFNLSKKGNYYLAENDGKQFEIYLPLKRRFATMIKEVDSESFYVILGRKNINN